MIRADPGLLSAMLSLSGLLISFLIVYLSVPRLTRKLQKEGIVGRDMLKRGEVMVPESGGIVIVLSVVASLSVITFIFTSYLYPSHVGGPSPSRQRMQLWMLSAIATILSVGFIGLVDDYLNIPQKYKVILPAFGAMPLAFAFLERYRFWIPLVGYVHIGLLYPLVLIPIGIAAAANLTNMYAGLNGLEIGSGLIATTFTCLTAVAIGRWSAVIVLSPMIGALAAFLLYNRYPARIFPGDVGTLTIGACLAVASIIGRIKVVAVIALAPQIVNFLQYLVNIRFFSSNPDAKFAKVDEDGTLLPPEGGEYGSLYFTMMHLFRRDEWWHVRLHWLICIISGIVAFLVGIAIYVKGVPAF